MRRRLPLIFAAGLGLTAVAYAVAAGYGAGGRGDFSPDTLDCRGQKEWLLPLVDVPLYRGRFTTHRWPVADYLVAEGLWSPSGAAAPRWLPTFQWNRQWSDGESQFLRELGWRGDEWIKWSKDHPGLAKALWPRVLAALRDPAVTDVDEAEAMMAAAREAETVDEFDRVLAERRGRVHK